MDGIVYLKTTIQGMIALENNKLLNKIKTESKYLLILTVVFIIIFKIIFYNESIITLIWAVISFFLTFTIPGFIICYLWHEKIDFIERFIVGNMIGMISVGIISYNISVYTNANIKYISILSPIIVATIFGIILYLTGEKRTKNKENKGNLQ